MEKIKRITYNIYIYASCIIKKIGNYILECKQNIVDSKEFIFKYSILLLIIYVIALFPLFRANFYYIDDLGRAVLGYRSWDNFSRFTNQELARFIHAGTYLNDISPLTQIIAIILLVSASLIVLNAFSDKKFRISYLIAMLPIGLSPYFLECLSYKFDSPYMALSVLSGVFPILFYKRNSIFYFVISFISTIIMCTTYQASAGIFPVIVILLFYKMWKDKDKECYKFAILSFFSYLSGLIIFKMFIMIPTDTYVSNVVFEIKELIPGAIRNYKNYFNIVLSDFKNTWLYLIGIIYIFFVITNMISTKRNKIITFLVSSFVLIVVNLFAFGIYPILTKPLFTCRAMYGTGIIISLISIMTINHSKVYISKIAVIVLGYVFVVFSCTYGNALAQQKRYTDFRIEQVISDLKNLEIMNNDNNKFLKIEGNIGQAPEIANYNKINDKTILDRLIPSTFCENWFWGYNYFFNYFGLKNITITNDLKDKNSMTLYTENIYHNIYYDDDYILIMLK